MSYDANGMKPPAGSQSFTASGRTDGTFHLRLLATSDIHAALLPYDYAADREDTAHGLACIASLVETARATAPGASLLVDNGDFLQGTPLGDLHDPAATPAPHPAIAGMNRLGYDAANLGNHEFNFGLPTLRAAVSQASFPVLSANTLVRKGPTPKHDETLLRPATILTRTCTRNTGETRTLRIGLIGLLPPQITVWDRFHLGGEVTARDMVETAAHHVPDLRRKGADIVILLAHTGIDTGEAGPEAENAALTLARLPGVDAIVAGHSHELFPDPKQTAEDGPADHLAGTFWGVPAVLPGFRGSHLGQIDLVLAQGTDGWTVTDHEARLLPVTPEKTPAHPAIVETVRDSHAATLARLRAPLGRINRPIHSYLSLYRSDMPVLLVAEAKRRAVRLALEGTALAGLPVLAATAPFNTGGRAGPRAYTDIPAGDLSLRNAVDLQPFPNSLCAVRLTGAELKDWLERATSCFNRITPGHPDQPLWNQAFPGHATDTMAGLTYKIDLSAPPLYDDRGQPLPGPPGPGRIRDLAHEGGPVAPGDEFIVAMNNYRAFGGGPYPVLPEHRLVHSSRLPVRQLLADFLRDGQHHDLDCEAAWRFVPMPETSVKIRSGPGLRDHPDDIAALGLTDLGLSDDGFLCLRMPLDAPACESAM